MTAKLTAPWAAALLAVAATPALRASEADIKIPDLSKVVFPGLGGVSGEALMYAGLAICVLGALFGLVQYE